MHNLTVSSSVGDITIDSVKDHLGSGEELTNRLASLTITKTSITTISNQGGEVTSSTVTTTTQENSKFFFKSCIFAVFFNLMLKFFLCIAS